jgi:hypothetical protein
MTFLGSRVCDTLVAACVALMMTMTAGMAAWAAGPQPESTSHQVGATGSRCGMPSHRELPLQVMRGRCDRGIPYKPPA